MNAIPNIKIRRLQLVKQFIVVAVAFATLCFGRHAATAQTTDTKSARLGGSSQSGEESPAHKYFTDIVLVTQNGEKKRFYTDLLQGKIVIINTFFATCKGSCVPMNRNLEKVQEALGDHIGKDVNILSISVDPTVDTPASLKEYAKTLNAKPGWYFLTGDQESVSLALKKLGQFVADKQDHNNIVLIGNDRTGLWKKAFGLAPSAELIKVVESVLNDKAASDK
jgi:protein SCO1/2